MSNTFEDKRGPRVVITGVGAVTALALTAEETWQGLLVGRSGIDYVTGFDSSQYPTRFAGQVKGFNPEDYMDRREARRLARFSQYGVAAARMAIADAGLTLSEEIADMAGVVLGNSAGSIPDIEDAVTKIRQGQARRLSPLFMVTFIPNIAAFHISSVLGLRGYSATICTACAAGTQAVGEAAAVIRRGQAQVMLTGGADAAVCETGLAGFTAMRGMSTYQGEPAKACRPFDRDRDGFLAAEGAAILVLETMEHAVRRGARIYAEVAGAGVTCDNYNIAAPDPSGDGLARAMRMALRDAGMSPDEIDYINPHGSGTPLNDVMETIAIKKVFGDRAYRIPISSTKSMLGHAMGAAGAIEAVVSTLTIRDNIVHPTINLENPDPECDLDYVPLVARRVVVNAVMSNSNGLGGQNASLILRRVGEKG